MTATLRGLYHVSINRIGTPELEYGEAWDLIETASSDTRTPLACELNGWRYPAGIIDLLQLAAAATKNSDQLMPWNLGASEDTPTEEQIAAALAELDGMT